MRSDVRRDRAVVAPGRQPEEPAHCLIQAVEGGSDLGGEAGHVDAARLDARRSERLLDDRQERAALAENPVERPRQIAGLAGVLEQHLAVTEDVVERGPQLMAEVRKAGGVRGHLHAPPPPNPPPWVGPTAFGLWPGGGGPEASA